MKGAFETGVYRNVFSEMGYTGEEIDKKIKDAFNTVFYGSEDEKFYHTVGDDMAYLEDTGNNDARTEGMSYGLTGFGNGYIHICTILKVIIKVISDGRAKQAVRKTVTDLLPTVKSSLPWRCFLLRTGGETAKEYLITPDGQEKYCMCACTTARMNHAALLCGIRTIN